QLTINSDVEVREYPTVDHSIGYWLNDPRTAAKLQATFAKLAELGGPAAQGMTDPDLLPMIMGMPIGVIIGFMKMSGMPEAVADEIVASLMS
ncbi:MAG: hypothetical protein H7X94_03555, partial [Vallitaleaceae bacterium]|nr:hypothetical protein [Vallitaleaceae bacterium]